ncbi:hypothetical protein SAMN06297251_10149 [Fulvimarina manganoxydans]|uniref:Uncharacterized protein n=1 Tax=Fulvimarina manganoxydans TaxID=937218 RepID=A0A1W1Y9Z5_9HYPH|nr:hypothetical protein [Fulvimarina manganoxydans]SMC32578.1 hypothetical protein SAMN06297251_10149 [Fulvimarina manganoxydans]
MYVFWTPDDLKRAIVAIEKQISSGASQISAPGGGGSVSLQRPAVAMRTLDRLYRAYEQKTGQTLDRARPQTKMKTFRINVEKDYYE